MSGFLGDCLTGVLEGDEDAWPSVRVLSISPSIRGSWMSVSQMKQTCGDRCTSGTTGSAGPVGFAAAAADGGETSIGPEAGVSVPAIGGATFTSCPASQDGEGEAILRPDAANARSLSR